MNYYTFRDDSRSIKPPTTGDILSRLGVYEPLLLERSRGSDTERRSHPLDPNIQFVICNSMLEFSWKGPKHVSISRSNMMPSYVGVNEGKSSVFPRVNMDGAASLAALDRFPTYDTGRQYLLRFNRPSGSPCVWGSRPLISGGISSESRNISAVG